MFTDFHNKTAPSTRLRAVGRLELVSCYFRRCQRARMKSMIFNFGNHVRKCEAEELF